MSRDCIGFNDGIVNDECKSCLQCVIIILFAGIILGVFLGCDTRHDTR